MDERLLYSQEELLARFDSLYEAIMVLSIRARQIGNNQLEAITALQKQYATVDVSRENLVDDEFDLSEPRDPIELPKFMKPTVAAIREAMENRIEWSYVELKTEEEVYPSFTVSEEEIGKATRAKVERKRAAE